MALGVGKFLEALYGDLSLYVRQSAWLNAVPERAKNSKSEGPRLSRLEKQRKAWAKEEAEREESDYRPDMPQVDAEHLLSYLWEVGPVLSSGGYPKAVTHEELRAWQSNTGIELDAWESRFLCRLSREYLLESNRAEKVDCPEPLRERADYVPDLAAVAKSMQQALKELAKL